MHENFHTKQRVHSARRTHAYITQLYIMSIQQADKAGEGQTDRQIETERQTVTNRDSNRKTDRQRETETDRQ